MAIPCRKATVRNYLRSLLRALWRGIQHQARVMTFISVCLLLIWLGISEQYHFASTAIRSGFVFLLLPVLILSRGNTSVRVGDFGEDWVECRFRLELYAQAFASSNYVVAENTDSTRDEIAAAIQSIRAAIGDDE